MIIELLQETIERGASDLHITQGLPPMMRIDGQIQQVREDKLSRDDIMEMVKTILDDNTLKELENTGEIDCAYGRPDLGRFRVNVFKQKEAFSIALRSIAREIPTLEALGLPTAIKEFTRKKKGLILVTGPTGSGKSTTLAAMIHEINKTRNCHILTIEDPIEYEHTHQNSIVNQREIGKDTLSFANALRASLRQDPDVILVGEMRDLETIAIAITAAETGHLVLSTLHTNGAASTIDRIVDVFPPHQQQQIRTQLSGVLEGIISQQLIPKTSGGRTAVLEILSATPAVRNLIREGKNHQLQSAIEIGGKHGMETMDNALLKLYTKRMITKETAIEHANNKEAIHRFL